MRSPRQGAQASPTPSLLVSGRSDYHLGVVSTHVHPDNTKRGLLLAPWADSRHCMGWNAELLREDAALAVIFGNDEDDQSPESVSFYRDALRGLKALANEMVRIYAVLGDTPAGCTDTPVAARRAPPRGPFWPCADDATAGKRYIELAGLPLATDLHPAGRGGGLALPPRTVGEDPRPPNYGLVPSTSGSPLPCSSPQTVHERFATPILS